jgi:hypothetical protein
MYTQAGSLVSLTDVILALCASGNFGVREAIAAATRQETHQMDQHSSEVQEGTNLQQACDVFSTERRPTA